MVTPWGISQSMETIQDGVTFYSTASHGGILVTLDAAQNLPQAAKDAATFRVTDEASPLGLGYWYEEDCDAAIPALFLGYAASPERARESINYWYPGLLEQIAKENTNSPETYDPLGANGYAPVG